MKKKVLSLLLVAAMGLTMLVGCGGGGNTDAGNSDAPKTIKVWVPDATVDFTKEQIAAWQKANADYAGYEVTVEAVGEGDAATNMITDVTAGADIYNFAQDQLSRLVAAEAISPIGGETATEIQKNNDEGSVGAATVGDKVYAFPITSDNGFFLYYDKSVITDVSSLDAILAQCATAGKGFYYQITSAWYNSAVFYAAGCNLDYTTNAEGKFVDSDLTIASDAGVAATKAMIELAKNAAHTDGSSIGDATNAAAVVTGTWDKQAAIDLWGDNYACAKLPTITINGQQVQMSGMSGYKLIGVKPQTDAEKQKACLSLAAWLSSEETQLARFEAVGWGPSNVNAQNSDAVKSDAVITAVMEQITHMKPQGQYPNEFWADVEAFGKSIDAGEFDNLTDAEILTKLQELQTKLEGYVVAE